MKQTKQFIMNKKKQKKYNKAGNKYNYNELIMDK